MYRSVYLCLHEATPCRSLRLQLRGYEISEYDYQYVEQVDEDTFLPRVSQRKAKKDILRADLKLIEYPGNQPSGLGSQSMKRVMSCVVWVWCGCGV